MSGGQKQRVAIAGILAMRPKCVVFDEATAMLDPVGRKEVMRILRKLNTEEGSPSFILHITWMRQARRTGARHKRGQMRHAGYPKEVFMMSAGSRALALMCRR